MKKITLLMAVLMWSSVFYAQTYLTEDFEGPFLPNGWVDEADASDYSNVTYAAIELVNSETYIIVTSGDTNFVAIGAADNNPGTVFTATGPGIGTGTATGKENNWAFSTVRANAGTRSAFFNDFNGNNDKWLITPVMNTSAGTSPEFTYYENLDNSVDFGGVTGVYYSTDYTGGDPTAATWTSVNAVLGTDAEDIWTLRGPYTLPVNATVYVAFRYTGNNKHDWWVDDVLVRETPTCVEPSAASFSSITTSSASFSWTPQGGESLWDVELVDITASGTPTGTPTTFGVSNPYVFNSLADGNKYEAYVRADCGGSTSAWAGPFVFITIPSNDDCAQAQVVVHELEKATAVSATATSGTINGATDSGLAVDPLSACYLVGITPNDDVWFAFVAKGPDVNITFDMAFDGVAELYSGTCGSLVLVDCSDDNVTGPAQEEINVTGLTAGNTYYVRIFYWWPATTPDGNFTVKIWSSEALSNNEFDTENAFRYYPNPVNNELNLRAQNTIENVSVYNMLGQEVLRVVPNTNSSTINISALQTGAYFIRVTINGVTETKQIIKR
jgi:Secretion system C-terminal sorting domain